MTPGALIDESPSYGQVQPTVPLKKLQSNDEKEIGKDSLTWTPEKNQFLLTQFKEQMMLGHASDGGLLALGWTELTNKLVFVGVS
ncbi:hypothetical protein CROQUDRAFT_95664 [Cronartium quercuum f. sp. fusiforme G11]|uniref:Uncharacterized protein n=1 Tax=Cronartium quercuum f. sp. fusiforme G11 TaxID=708437 RepID=A0A9P6NE74_9BASI|nr:hypothetical protein CROQUDRAFT_95664 [Cronartium quercuum f. sp. fusiforme G11]